MGKSEKYINVPYRQITPGVPVHFVEERSVGALCMYGRVRDLERWEMGGGWKMEEI